MTSSSAGSALVYNPPPNWPVGPGFVPPDGWSPDPAWGPAPEGWSLWLPAETGAETGIPADVEPDAVGEAKAEDVADVRAEIPPEVKPKKHRTKAIIAAVVAAVLVTAAIVVVVVVQQQKAAEQLLQQQKAAEELAAAWDGYQSSTSALGTSLKKAEGVFADSKDAVLDESPRALLEKEIKEASESLAVPVDQNKVGLLTEQTGELDQAKSELDAAIASVEKSVDALTELVEAQKGLADATAAANEAVPRAEQVHADSGGKINDPGLRDALAATIEEVRSQVGRDSDGLGAPELVALTSSVKTATQKMKTAADRVTSDQAAWQKAADQAAAAAALVDPASYASIASRDWQLVERDPAAYANSMYVIYGRVTQFDSNTGSDAFRASTDGQKQAEWYDYDINTICQGSGSLLTNVVQGDLVKMYVKVIGPHSYTTTMGGTLTVPMVQVNIIEVYGSE